MARRASSCCGYKLILFVTLLNVLLWLLYMHTYLGRDAVGGGADPIERLSEEAHHVADKVHAMLRGTGPTPHHSPHRNTTPADMALSDGDDGHSEEKILSPATTTKARTDPHSPPEFAAGCRYEGPVPGFLPGCAQQCRRFTSLDDAKAACLADTNCGGVTQLMQTAFELREGSDPMDSPQGETSFLKACPEPQGPQPPEEWKVPTEIAADLDTVGTYIDGEPTIFLNIAAFRDDLCHTSLELALKRADKPNRLFFGVVDQMMPGDTPCDFTEKPCSEDPSQTLCIHAQRIRIDRVNAGDALGPTFGRHRADRMYRGEYFAMQVDGHTYFANHWDTDIIEQWRTTKNEYAVLSTYPSDLAVLDADGNIRSGTSPVICDSRLVSNKMVKHEAATEIYPRFGNSPILHPLWGAGLSFSRGHRVLRVPYDCCLHMMFDGEEFSMAVRMWTHGYDFYAPRKSVIAHPYHRKKKPPLFFSNGNKRPGAASRSARRVLALLGVHQGRDFDAFEIGLGEKYGLGTRRELATYMKLFGYDIAKGHVRGNCRWAETQQLHQDLAKYLRKDGKGLDYTKVPVDELNSQRQNEKKQYR